MQLGGLLQLAHPALDAQLGEIIDLAAEIVHFFRGDLAFPIVFGELLAD